MKNFTISTIVTTAALLLFVQTMMGQIPVTDDAFTSSAAPNANYGVSLGLVVQSPTAAGSMSSPVEQGGFTANSYLKFDLSALPPNVTAANLAKANLRLYVDFVVSPGTFDIYQAAGSWNEGTLTAGNAPGIVGSPINQSPISVTKALQYIDIDITPAFAKGPPANGLVLVPTKGSPIFVSFDSKENPLTSHDPELSVSVNDASSTQLQQEIQRATLAENIISTNLATETTRATGVENGLTSGLNAEIARAKTAEGGLGTSLNNETARATGAETGITNALNSEIANRVAGDTKALGTATAYTDAGVANEAAQRIATDNTLQGNLTALQSSLSGYAQLGVSNKFAAGQVINGDLSANNVNAAGLLTANGALLPAVQQATPAQGFPSNPFDMTASVSDGTNSQNETFRWQVVPVNNGTPNLGAQLSLMYGGGVSPSPTGFSINADGTQNFAPSQTFNGQHSGDGSGLRNVNAVTAQTALTATTATSSATALTAGSAVTFTAALGGDVSGAQSSTSVVALAGIPLSRGAPKDGQVLIYNAAANQWQPGNASTSSNAVAPPVTPPTAYDGQFSLEISTGSTSTVMVDLVSFAGCDEKLLGVLYDDCYFQIHNFSSAISQWLTDTLNGTNATRNAVVHQKNSSGNIIQSIQITQAFLRDLTVSDSSDNSNAPGLISFVLVPASLMVVTGNAGPPPPASQPAPPPNWESNMFTFNISNADTSQVFAVTGIHMSVPKLPAPAVGGYLQFQPGSPRFDDISIFFGARQTATDLQNWAGNVASGNSDQRSATLQVFGDSDGTQVIVGTVQLSNLSPRSISPFPSGFSRVLQLSVGSFSLQ